MARIQSPFRSKRPSLHRDTERRSHRCQVASARVCHAQVRQAASSLGRHAENFSDSTTVSVIGKMSSIASSLTPSSRVFRFSTVAPSTSRFKMLSSRDFGRRSVPICSPSTELARRPANVHQRLLAAVSRTTAVATVVRKTRPSSAVCPKRFRSANCAARRAARRALDVEATGVDASESNGGGRAPW